VLPATVRLDWKVIARFKLSSLLGKSVTYSHKKFYNIGPWWHIKLFTIVIY